MQMPISLRSMQRLHRMPIEDSHIEAFPEHPRKEDPGEDNSGCDPKFVSPQPALPCFARCPTFLDHSTYTSTAAKPSPQCSSLGRALQCSVSSIW